MVCGLFILLLIALAAVVTVCAVLLSIQLVKPPRHTIGGAVARGLPTDPKEAGAGEFETQTIRDAGGEEMELWLVKGTDPGGPTMVLLHGWGDSRLGELLWLDLLTPVASRLVLFDLRGHGESRQRWCTFGVEELGDVMRVIDWAAALEPVRPIVLMGYSMGASIAMNVAAEAGGKVAGVIAESPYRKVVDAIAAVLRLNRLPSGLVAFLAIGLLRTWWPGVGKINSVRSAGRMTQPLLLLHGSQDQVVSSAEIREIAAAAAQGVLCEVEGAEHLQATTLDPVRCEAAIEEFVRSLLAGRR